MGLFDKESLAGAFAQAKDAVGKAMDSTKESYDKAKKEYQEKKALEEEQKEQKNSMTKFLCLPTVYRNPILLCILMWIRRQSALWRLGVQGLTHRRQSYFM